MSLKSHQELEEGALVNGHQGAVPAYQHDLVSEHRFEPGALGECEGVPTPQYLLPAVSGVHTWRDHPYEYRRKMNDENQNANRVVPPSDLLIDLFSEGSFMKGYTHEKVFLEQFEECALVFEAKPKNCYFDGDLENGYDSEIEENYDLHIQLDVEDAHELEKDVRKR